MPPFIRTFFSASNEPLAHMAETEPDQAPNPQTMVITEGAAESIRYHVEPPRSPELPPLHLPVEVGGEPVQAGGEMVVVDATARQTLSPEMDSLAKDLANANSLGNETDLSDRLAQSNLREHLTHVEPEPGFYQQ